MSRLEQVINEASPLLEFSLTQLWRHVEGEKGRPIGIISADRVYTGKYDADHKKIAYTPAELKNRYTDLAARIERQGYRYIRLRGMYGGPERSYFVIGDAHNDDDFLNWLKQVAAEYNQETVIYLSSGAKERKAFYVVTSVKDEYGDPVAEPFVPGPIGTTRSAGSLRFPKNLKDMYSTLRGRQFKFEDIAEVVLVAEEAFIALPTMLEVLLPANTPKEERAAIALKWRDVSGFMGLRGLEQYVREKYQGKKGKL